MDKNATPQDVLYRLHTALNQRNLDAMVACFAPDFQSEQPAHPGVEFVGNDQVRKNWSLIFGAVPDFHAELVRSAIDGDTVWAEWFWYGHRTNGAPMQQRGVTVLQVQNGKIAAARLYMEFVQAPAAGIDGHVRSQLQTA